MILRSIMIIDMSVPRLCFFTTIIGMSLSKVDTIPASSWTAREHHQPINSFLDVTSARSKLDCVRHCSRFSQCMACAFESNPLATETEGGGERRKKGTPGICYLMPSITSSAGTHSTPVTVLSRENQETSCQESKSLVIANGRVTSWRRTLTSLEGVVSCDADYMYVGTDPVMKCFISNQWQPLRGSCKQRFWRSMKTGNLLDVPVPKPVGKGWSLCLNATPTQFTRVAINLVTKRYQAIMHLDFRLSYLNFVNTIVMDSNYSGVWGWQTKLMTPNPFPLSPGTPFTLILTVLTDKDIQIIVTGNQGSWSKPSRSLPGRVQEVTRVTFSGDFSISSLDVWCNQDATATQP